MTPDRYRRSVSPTIPQSWNRYSYVLGDPVNANNPTGKDCTASSFSSYVYGGTDPGSIEDDAPSITSYYNDNGTGCSQIAPPTNDANAGCTAGNYDGGETPSTCSSVSYTGSADTTGTTDENDNINSPAGQGADAGTPASDTGGSGSQPGSISNSPASGSVFIPVYGPLGVQIGVNLLGPGNGSCLSLGLAAGWGRSASAGTFGTPLATGNLSQATSILSGWGGSASVIIQNWVGYQVAYGSAGAIGGPAAGWPGMSFSYGYSICH